MRRFVFITLFTLVSILAFGQKNVEARKILDKTAAVVGRSGGAFANFKLSRGKIGATYGTIAIKGKMFNARTSKVIIWYNGKTQWSYHKSTNEVNVSTPTEAQRMSMNPYTFITMYKNGYMLDMTKKDNDYLVHMTAQDKQRTVQEAYLTINSKTYAPSMVKMREGSTWTTISITNFQAKNQHDSIFTFNAKDFPTAEIIDLR